MSLERAEDAPHPASETGQISDGRSVVPTPPSSAESRGPESGGAPNQASANKPREAEAAERHEAAAHEPREATVIVRGEAVGDGAAKGRAADPAKPNGGAAKKKVVETKVRMQSRLPALRDDGEIGVQKHQVVTRDGEADLTFTGTLLASAGSPSAPAGKWHEYRVYETDGGKHVFSKIKRTIYAGEEDSHEAEIFDPSPSMPSKLLRSARELTRSRPVEWTDAAADFFGYDPLAKALYRKLGSQFEEHIS